MSRFIEKFALAIDWLSDRLFQVASLICLPALTLVITVDVFMRYVFNAPLIWSFEFSEIMLMIILFGSVPFTTKTNNNIRMELLYSRFRGRMLRFANVLWGASGLFFSVLLAVRTAEQIPVLYRMHRMKDFLGVPTWPFNVFVLVIAVVLSLYFLHLMFFGQRRGTGITDAFDTDREEDAA
jgi:TRAP-type C4-dicarboxylate transport system permease small subunit